MMQVGNWTFEIFRSNQGLELHVTSHKAAHIYGLVTENDLARIGHWFSPATTPKTDGIDRAAAEQIISAGVRELAKKHHPDKGGGSSEIMTAVNGAADWLRDQILRR